MIETCRREKVKLGCVFQRRTMPEAIAVKKAIDTGALGKLVLADTYLILSFTRLLLFGRMAWNLGIGWWRCFDEPRSTRH